MQRGGSTARGYQANKRRIGKKAIALLRTSMLIERKLTPPPKPRRKLAITWRPKRLHYAIFAVFALIGLAGTAGYGYYQNEQAKVQQAAATVAQERARVASQKSDECRKQKVAAKTELLGKVTYDELYDYSVCDFSD